MYIISKAKFKTCGGHRGSRISEKAVLMKVVGVDGGSGGSYCSYCCSLIPAHGHHEFCGS